MKVNNETGEVLETNETNEETLYLAKRELNELTLFEPWLQAKENLLTAKEQFEMVDVPFKKMIEELFMKYSIKSISNDYISITDRNGYPRMYWDDEKLTEFIVKHGEKPEHFKTSKWINGGIQIKYKE